jgi:hypothetical protein
MRPDLTTPSSQTCSFLRYSFANKDLRTFSLNQIIKYHIGRTKITNTGRKQVKQLECSRKQQNATHFLAMDCILTHLNIEIIQKKKPILESFS